MARWFFASKIKVWINYMAICDSRIRFTTSSHRPRVSAHLSSQAQGSGEARADPR